jgi:alcohol dehydrogenase class IV
MDLKNMQMRQLSISQPRKVLFGENTFLNLPDELKKCGIKNLLCIIATPLRETVLGLLLDMEVNDIAVILIDPIQKEPTIGDVEAILTSLKQQPIDAVAGIGGGSVMDVAKVVAAKLNNSQPITEMLGIGNLNGRTAFLACIPTTSGTGSESSPNSILLDETDNMKKGIISPFLVPDLVIVDPALTTGVPPSVTAETGIDALCHCIEAYTNKFAHPLIDLYALEGVRLIAGNLLKAYRDGSDMEARTHLSIGSYYGGLCLGPVNTSAVHALSYPLGGEYHIPHGLANAILLPAVFEFNAPADVKKHAQIAAAMGVDSSLPQTAMIRLAVEKLTELLVACNVPTKLSALGVDKSNIDNLANKAMGVQRLLKNNPRELTLEDAKAIYHKLF